MNAARAQAQRFEQAIEIGNRSAADERERALKLVFGPRQCRHDTGRRHDVIRPRRQIEQRAVDVEKQRQRAIAKRRYIFRPRPLGAARSIDTPATPAFPSPHLSRILGDSLFAVWPLFRQFS